MVAKDRIRKFLKELNREKQTTILLTSHDMMDIDEICSRVILIDHGKKMLDEPLEDFTRLDDRSAERKKQGWMRWCGACMKARRAAMNEEQGLKNVIDYIEAHIRESLSAEEIASACYYSRSNTKALF